MCTSIIQTIFNLTLLAATGLLVASLVTPAWGYYNKKMEESGSKDSGHVDRALSGGVFFKKCFYDDAEKCGKDVWNSYGPHEKITAVLLILSVGFCVATMVWSCVAYFGCCCKPYLLTPLPILAGVAVLLDLGAILAYVLYDDQTTAKIEEVFDVTKRSFGYSMWFAVVAGAGLLANVVLGIAMICCATVSPV